MLEFKVSVDELDYGAVAAMLLPMVKEKAAENPSGSRAVKLLLGMANAAGELPIKAINALPQDVKDEMVVMLVNNYKDKFIEVIQNKAAAKNISLTVNDLAARTVKPF